MATPDLPDDPLSAGKPRRHRPGTAGPTPEELAERFKIEGDPEDVLRVLLGVKVPPEEESEED